MALEVSFQLGTMILDGKATRVMLKYRNVETDEAWFERLPRDVSFDPDAGMPAAVVPEKGKLSDFKAD